MANEVIVDESTFRRLIDQEFIKNRLEEMAWTAETDCDRLSRAFESLTARGIVSLVVSSPVGVAS
jgi:hypothetical protein